MNDFSTARSKCQYSGVGLFRTLASSSCSHVCTLLCLTWFNSFLYDSWISLTPIMDLNQASYDSHQLVPWLCFILVSNAKYPLRSFVFPASSQHLQTETVNIRYPKILSNESVECDCVDYCDSAYWFHTAHSEGHVKFLGRYNNADRVNYGSNVEQSRFKLSKRGSSSFALRIIAVTEKDAGIYSCVLKDKSNKDMWRPGTLLLPGGVYTS